MSEYWKCFATDHGEGENSTENVSPLLHTPTDHGENENSTENVSPHWPWWGWAQHWAVAASWGPPVAAYIPQYPLPYWNENFKIIKELKGLHWVTNDLNLRIKTEPITMDKRNMTGFCSKCTEWKQRHLLQPWHNRFLCQDSDYCWDSVASNIIYWNFKYFWINFFLFFTVNIFRVFENWGMLSDF